MAHEEPSYSESISDMHRKISREISSSEREHKQELEILLDILRSFESSAHQFNNQMAEILDDRMPQFDVKSSKNEIKKLYSTFQTRSYTVMVIGSGVTGKSTIINLIANKHILPVNQLSARPSFLTLTYNEHGQLFTCESHNASNFVEQNVIFDDDATQPSDVIKAYFENNHQHSMTTHVQVKYPIPLLETGITIYESRCDDTSSRSKKAFNKYLFQSDMFIIVLSGGVLPATVKLILEQLMEAGRDSHTLLFILTHMEVYSSNRQRREISKLLSNLHEINTAFDDEQIVVLNANTALDMFNQKHNCTDEYYNFMQTFTSFISKTVPFKIRRIYKELRNLLQSQSISIDDNIHKAQYCIRKYSRKKFLLEQQVKDLENAKDRLALKLDPVVLFRINHVCVKIFESFQTGEFKNRLENLINTMRIPDNEETVADSRANTLAINVKIGDLWDRFKEATKSILTSIIDPLISDRSMRLGNILCDDINLFGKKRRSYLAKIDRIGAETILTQSQTIISQLLQFREITDNTTKTVNASKGSHVWRNLYYSEGNRFLSILINIFKNNIKNMFCSDQNIRSITNTFFEKVSQSIMASEQDMVDIPDILNNVQKLLLTLQSFQKTVIEINSKLNESHPSDDVEWSLTPDMLENVQRLRNQNENTSENLIPVMRACLRTKSKQKSIQVQVNRLSGHFCAEHVWREAHIRTLHAETNVLYCHGSYRQGTDIHLVTEPWECTLKSSLTSTTNLSEENRIQIAIDLVDICIRHGESIPTKHLSLNSLLLTKNKIVKLNLVGYPETKGLRESTKIEREIINALSIVFATLLHPIRHHCPLIDSLCSFGEESGVLLCHRWNDDLTLNDILLSLKYIQNKYILHASKISHPLSTSRRPIGLLAVDGGGTRGIIAAMILEKIQETIGKPLWNIFQHAAGSSTGGLLVISALVRRSDPKEMVEIYRLLPSKIFRGRLLPITPYPLEPLQSELKIHFGNLRMSKTDDHAPNVFVVTKQNHEPYPFLIRSYETPKSDEFLPGESGWFCTDAARATTAAPTFFDAFNHNGHCFRDGAMGYDNPSLLLLHEFLALHGFTNKSFSNNFANLPHIDFIVSIGTGDMDTPPLSPGAPERGLRFTLNMMQIGLEWLADSETAHYHMNLLCKVFGNIPYFRFNPKLKRRVALDAASDDDIAEFITITNEYLNNEKTGAPQMIRTIADLVNRRES